MNMRRIVAWAALVAAALPFAAVSAETGSNFDLTSTNFRISVGEFSPLAGKGIAAATSGGGINNVNTGAAYFVKIMMIALSIVCFLSIVINGLRLATPFFPSDQGRDNDVNKAKYGIMWSLVGLFLALSSYAIIATAGWLLS